MGDRLLARLRFRRITRGFRHAPFRVRWLPVCQKKRIPHLRKMGGSRSRARRGVGPLTTPPPPSQLCCYRDAHRRFPTALYLSLHVQFPLVLNF